jgi:hypothetical protein
MDFKQLHPPLHFLTPPAGRLDPLRAAKEAMSRLHLGKALPALRGRIAAGPSPLHNVVGVGIGERLVAGRPTGTLAIKILVRIKYPDDQLTDGDRLPKEIFGIPIDVEQVGTFQRLGAVAGQPGAVAPPNPRSRLRPLQPGCSVGFVDAAHPVVVAGTFGFLATDGTKQYVVSNNHVLADENRLTPGGAILQPGLLDGGDPNADRIATLVNFSPLSLSDPNTVDCAMAALDDGQVASPAVLHLGAPQGTAPAAMDMVVHKFGRTTSYRVGRVTSVDTDLSVDYGLGAVTFHGQILIKGVNNQPFSDGGDSGALVVERATGKAVGLLFAGSPSHSAANHIEDVLATLHVRLASA